MKIFPREKNYVGLICLINEARFQLTHILYFSRDYTTHDHRFLSSLTNAQFEVSYLRLEQRGAQLEDRPIPSGVRTISWTGGNREVKLRDGPRLFSDLKKVIRETNPDLVHAGPIQSCAFLVALAGFQPLVSASWGYDLLYDANRNKFWRWASVFTLRRSAIMIGDCNTIREKAVELGMSPERVVTFPWGMDIKKFTPGKYPPSNGDNFTLLSTRSWEPIYGVDILAEAFVKAAKEYKGLKLIMLGNGSQANQLRGIFNRGRVMDHVIFPGQISQRDLPRYYRMADLYVSASHVDGSSISLMEALACGRPVAVSDIPGNLEWVDPDVHGWIFKDGNSNDLCEVILGAIYQRQKLVEMSKAARKQAETRADWDKNFPNLIQAYKTALQGS